MFEFISVLLVIVGGISTAALFICKGFDITPSVLFSLVVLLIGMIMRVMVVEGV